MALLRVKTGQASLDGKPIRKAQMAAEGQKLSLKPGAQVRVMLMGTSSEVMLEGPKTLTLNKESLLSKSKAVNRGEVAVAEDIGNTDTVTARVSRNSRKLLKPVLPPVLLDGEYVIKFDGGERFVLGEETDVEFSIQPLSQADGLPYYSPKITSELRELRISPDVVKPGERYKFELKLNGSGLNTYSQTFRIISEEETAFLKATETALVKQHEREESILPLLRLAHLAIDLDQNRLAYKYIEMAAECPYTAKESLKLKLEDLRREFKRTTEMGIPVKEVYPKQVKEETTPHH